MNSFLCCAHPDLHKLRQLANSVRKTQKNWQESRQPSSSVSVWLPACEIG